MTELRSLLDSSDDELELALLRSARSDLPQASGLHDTALALGLTIPIANGLIASLPSAGSLGASSGTALGSAATGSAATGSAAGGGASGVVGVAGAVSLSALGKSLVGGALVSFMALTTYDQTLGAHSQRAPSSVAGAVGVAVAPPTRADVAPAGPVQPIAPAPVVEAPGAEAGLVAAGRPRAASAVAEDARSDATGKRSDAPAKAAFATDPRDPPRPSPASANASLAAEIRVLDQARAALAVGESDRASRLLDAYAASRPGPTLAQEAALLRVRLLLTRGQRPAAAALARRIIAEHPESAHVDSLRSLAKEP